MPEALVPQPDVVPSVNVKIVDGALLVHKLYLRKASIHTKTFQDYAQWFFLPYTEHILQDVARVYIVWDVYREDDLKAQTQQNHGAGSEICAANNTSVPANWNNNLHIDTNMDGLLKLLANAAQEFESPREKQIISTHEEVDTRFMVHASQANCHGFSKVMILFLSLTDFDLRRF